MKMAPLLVLTANFTYFSFLQMAVQVKMISKKKLLTGEGPHWDEKTQSLYFVDIPGCTINKYDSKSGLHTQAKICKNKRVDKCYFTRLPYRKIRSNTKDNKFLVCFSRSSICDNTDRR